VLKMGTRGDYFALERFHYVAGRPATFAGIYAIEHERWDELTERHVTHPVAVAVVSYPCLRSSAREVALKLQCLSAKRREIFVNRNIRTISRVIIHPTYRGLGLARILIEAILKNPPTRFIEALATMAKAHPLFKRAGMEEFPALEENKPTYYLFDQYTIIRPSGGVPSQPQGKRPRRYQ
jgi:GNAT superfamily N-acetyltransferase